MARLVTASRAPKQRELVAIVGPSGAGKSELALELARELDAEIVNCDALQVYRGLDIGTAKVVPSGQRGIPHHLVNVISPDEEFSAADYIARAAPVIEDIAERGKLPPRRRVVPGSICALSCADSSRDRGARPSFESGSRGWPRGERQAHSIGC